MAQELAIAKAALSASLFRADPASLSRPQVESLFPLIEAAITQCSRPNVQKCKAWIVSHVAPSSARITSLGRYLVALCKNQNSQGSKTSTKRRRLHVLYIVNDVAHHLVTGEGGGISTQETLSHCWDQHLPALVASAASFQRVPKHVKKLEALVDLWEERGYFSADLMPIFRAAISTGASGHPTTQDTSLLQKTPKDPPYSLPSFHGDSSTPWYDLPAGTWLPQLKPNSTRVMRTEEIRPFPLKPGPADEKLVSAVKTLLSNVDRLYAKGSKWGDELNVDVNMLGERIVRDEITGDIIDGDTYYGWSRSFCTQMKERKRRVKGDRRGPRSRSRSRSRPPHSRASSRSSGWSRSHTRDRTRRSSYTRSRSPRRSASPSRGLTGDRRPGDSRGGSRSRSPYRGSRRDHSYTKSPSRSRSRSKEYQPREPLPPQPPQPQQPPSQSYPYPPHQAIPAFNNLPPVPPQGDYIPFPPSLPSAGYQGIWPPPPPPPPHWFPPTAGGMGWVPPTPPPPPLQPHYTAGQYTRGNRGGGRGRGRGRGGYEYQDHSGYGNQGWR